MPFLQSDPFGCASFRCDTKYFPGFDCHNRARNTFNNAFCRASHQYASHALPAVGTHHHKVYIILLNKFHDFFKRLEDINRDRHYLISLLGLPLRKTDIAHPGFLLPKKYKIVSVPV